MKDPWRYLSVYVLKYRIAGRIYDQLMKTVVALNDRIYIPHITCSPVFFTEFIKFPKLFLCDALCSPHCCLALDSKPYFHEIAALIFLKKRDPETLT